MHLFSVFLADVTTNLPLESWWIKSFVDNGPWAVMVMFLARWLLKRIDELIAWHKTYVDKMAGNYDALSSGITVLGNHHEEKSQLLDAIHTDVKDIRQKVIDIHTGGKREYPRKSTEHA